MWSLDGSITPIIHNDLVPVIEFLCRCNYCTFTLDMWGNDAKDGEEENYSAIGMLRKRAINLDSN